MVLRIFLILLAVNTIAFVARADAADIEREGKAAAEIRVMTEAGLYDGVGAEGGEDVTDLADLGARLLMWRFTRDRDEDRERFASDRVFADHGVNLVEDGAALNLMWRF